MRLRTAAPVLLSSDLERTAAWYRDGLGFECSLFGDPPNFLAASRDGAQVMYALAAPADIVPNWRRVENIWNVYVQVEDVDAVYAEIQERGTELDYTICDQAYGMRDFGVQDPDGHDIGFGQPIA